MTKLPDDQVLERNVSTLLESGGETPRISAAARTRIRAELQHTHGQPTAARSKLRIPLLAVGAGLVATAAAALVISKPGDGAGSGAGVVVAGTDANQLADGTTWTAGPGGTLAVIGDRRVRVEGPVLLDVAPGKGQFVVETARGTIKVIGTRFLVDGAKDKTTAAVVRGVVQLASRDGEVTLHAGEQGIAEPGRPPSRGPAPRLSSLVSWAKQARRKAEADVQPIRNGTLFAREPNNPHVPESPLPIAKLTVDVVVEDQVARVALDQTFHNPAPQVMEGMYRFAIPPDAALQRLAMYVNGTLTESAVVERMAARRIYEDVVYRRLDPALLEWAGTGRLNLRVYPLPPRQDKRLLLAYTQSLPKLYDDYTVTVPLPEVDQPVGELDFAVRIAGCSNCEVTSPSHDVKVSREGDDARVAYTQKSVRIGDSLVLHVRDTRRTATVATEGPYLLVRARPELPAAQKAYRPRTWIILDDVSASRGTMELRAQSDLVDNFLTELDEADRVAVVAFDTAPRVALPLTRVDAVDRRAVRTALTAEGGVGATDVAAALAKATELLAGVAPDDAMVVYLGDGVITAGARDLESLRTQLRGKAKFIGVGIGDGPDTQTLAALAAATDGYSTTIDLADDVGWRAFDLVAALHTTRVVGLAATLVDGNGTALPANVYLGRSQLGDGEELEVVGKLDGTARAAALQLTGTVDGQPWSQRVVLNGAATNAGYLPRLWAQRHLAARMLAKHEPVQLAACSGDACPTEAEVRSERNEKIRQEVVALGKEYFLLSRHTSLLVLEDDAMYAKYNVKKGEGDTWAPYAAPATIPVPTTFVPTVDVAVDAELTRSPLQLFYDYAAFDNQRFESRRSRGGGVDDAMAFDLAGPVVPLTDSPRSGDSDREPAPAPSRPQGEVVAATAATETKADVQTIDVVRKRTSAEPDTGDDWTGADKAADRISVDELVGGARDPQGFGTGSASFGAGGSMGRAKNKRSYAHVYGQTIQAVRLTYPNDASFNDLTAFVPALVTDGADLLRQDIVDQGGVKAHAIDPAAQRLLAAARAALPAGVYRWGDREIAVDSARRFGWKRTTSTGLGETASYDGSTFTRRYAELGLDVTRAYSEDDIALAFAYFPLWIAEPAHYARYFEVGAQGTREVTLSRMTRGAKQVVYVLAFDDQSHLVAIRDGHGRALFTATWSGAQLSGITSSGEAIDVGFSGQPLGDVASWAHGSTNPGVVVSLPGHVVAYWDAAVKKLAVGSAEWRHAQRQRMVALAAVGQPYELRITIELLAANGGVELGDAVLASGGILQLEEGKRAPLLAAISRTPVGVYLGAMRFGDSGMSIAKAEVTSGLIGGLWQLREATALAYNQKWTAAADRLLGIEARALDFRLVGASMLTNQYNAPAIEVARAWDAAAVGPYKNTARAAAAMAFLYRGDNETGTERLLQLATDLDLRAAPPQLTGYQYAVQQSRRGPAGWQMIWNTVKDKVLAGGSLEHVLAILPLAQQANASDVSLILAKAATLAADDPEMLAMLAELGVSMGQVEWAQNLVQPLLARSPTSALHRVAATIAQRQSRTADSLHHLEEAFRLADPSETLSLTWLRSELQTIIEQARQIATAASGQARTDAIAKLMSWARTWRELDSANPRIDGLVGNALLSLGETAEAWRQLSTIIERDPMDGANYMMVAEVFEQRGRVAEAIDLWQQALILDQTNPTPRMRKAQALITVGRTAEGDQLLAEIANRKWHVRWDNVIWQVKNMQQRAAGPR